MSNLIYFIWLVLAIVPYNILFLWHFKARLKLFHPIFVLNLIVLLNILSFYIVIVLRNSYGNSIDYNVFKFFIFSFYYYSFILVIVYSILKMVKRKQIFRFPLDYKVSIKKINYLITFFICFYLLLLFLLILETGIKPWENPLGFRVVASHNYGHFNILLMISMVVLAFLIAFKVYLKNNWLNLFLVLIYIILLYIYGSRSRILLIVVAYLFIINIYKKEIIINFSLKNILVIFSFLAFSIGYNLYRLSKFGLDKNIFDVITEPLFRFNYFYNGYRFLEKYYYELVSTEWFYSIKYTLTIMIPRFLYPEKPFAPQTHIQMLTNNLNNAPSLGGSSGIIADAYLSYGYYGILIYGILSAIILYFIVSLYENIVKKKDFLQMFIYVYFYSISGIIIGGYLDPILQNIVVYSIVLLLIGRIAIIKYKKKVLIK